MSVKGYKVFNPDWTCRGFQYAVGETFRHEGEIDVCEAGFHFCAKVADCFNYYDFNSNNKVAEIEATGNVKTEGDKSVTNEIRIVREISWHEVLDLSNTGKNCTGYNNTGNWNSGNRNSGYWNSGNCNSGDCNSGNRNSGDRNSGDYNSGNYNSGNYNSGDYNSGDYNSGYCNTGDYNSGYWNSCDYSTGFFNSVAQPVYAFNKPLNVDMDEFRNCDGINILTSNFVNNMWIRSAEMTAEEKQKHPEHEHMGGYLKTVDFRTACGMMWDKLTAEEKRKVCEIPNFDASVFEEITGIDVTDGGESECG